MVAVLTPAALGGCNTIAGFGQDTQSAGIALKHSAEKIAAGDNQTPVAAPQTEHPLSGASMPSSPQQFKAYFGLNQASLSAEDNKAVQAAAAALHANPVATIRLVGKTDTSGSESYNLQLSQRRTDTVYKALIAAGVPADRIERKAVGESQLEVPTKNGIRDSQNRVVDIFVGI